MAPALAAGLRRSLCTPMLLLAFALQPAAAEEPLRTDPNHLRDGGYGYLVSSGAPCSVWWAEAAYKVMRDAPLPTRKDGEIKLWSAANEYESFLLVVRPEKRLDNFRLSLTPFTDGSGRQLPALQITVRQVEYVRVSKPTDTWGFAGWWPDPLPLLTSPTTLYPRENQPFWITVKVPAGAAAGFYSARVLLQAGDWRLEVPVRLQVWDFTLPQTPTMRSGFGLDMATVKEYEKITDPGEERQLFDYYMESFRDYKISPYNPFLYAPIEEEIRGVAWQGGFFDSREPFSGRYSFRLVDRSTTSSSEGSTRDLIPLQANGDYQLRWQVKSEQAEQSYVVGIECYDAGRELLTFENRFEAFTAAQSWRADSLRLGPLAPEIACVKIRLFPANRTRSGEHLGTAWFDEVALINRKTGANALPAGNFEVEIDSIDIDLDFSDFNAAGRRYFDKFGFTGFNLALKGLGSGTYYSRTPGAFAGFEQGTEEYERLMGRYLRQMEENLAATGWLGKEYIYWFDEPGENDYPFVRETNALIKKHAPRLTTFLTEHVAGQDISDVTDISCTIWHKLDHEKIGRVNARGLEHWSYLCCWPKSPWISEFIDHDAINLRMWLWASYRHGLKGILIWETTYWNSQAASPPGHLQNPWEEAMSFVSGYGWPLGKQTIWGNGDGRYFYPSNRDPNHDQRPHLERPIPSLRLEILRDGIEDYEYLVMLEKALAAADPERSRIAREAAALLQIPEAIYKDEKSYSKNPQDILAHRKKVARAIEQLAAGAAE